MSISTRKRSEGQGAEAHQPQARGLRCRKCGGGKFWVIYTRAREDKLVRRRECRNCKTRVTTWETAIGCGGQ